MKIAFVHDWFSANGGAEKVAKEIIDLIQPSHIFTLFNFLPPKELLSITQGKPMTTSFLQRIPGMAENYRYFAPIFPKAVEQFDLSTFDVIISSSWMVAKGVKTRADQKHICYCHTPMRFAWDMEGHYLQAHAFDRGWKKWLVKKMLNRLRSWDVETSKSVDLFIANSRFIAKRIEKAYRRPSMVIHPPVNVNFFSRQDQKDEYYLVASRMVDYKNLHLIIDAFAKLPAKHLVIAGQGPLENSLRIKASSNVTFVGWVSDERLKQLYQHAKAFINASVEDFGIAGLEAQACGTPVIALGKGGYLETVIEGETGVFFQREHAEAIADAILRFERSSFDPRVIRRHAEAFSSEHFRESFIYTFLDKCFDHEPSMA